MEISREKRAFIASILGESETEKMLNRLTQLEAGLKQAGIAYKEVGTAGDVLAELLMAVESGQTSIDEVRKEVGPEVADVLQRVMKSRKDTASLEDIRASIAKARELIAKLDADAQAAEAEKDTSPIAKFARMLTGSKGKKEVKLEDDGHPAHRYAQGLVDGRVEGGG